MLCFEKIDHIIGILAICDFQYDFSIDIELT